MVNLILRAIYVFIITQRLIETGAEGQYKSTPCKTDDLECELEYRKYADLGYISESGLCHTSNKVNATNYCFPICSGQNVERTFNIWFDGGHLNGTYDPRGPSMQCLLDDGNQTGYTWKVTIR